jgi:hypothetical protein
MGAASQAAVEGVRVGVDGAWKHHSPKHPVARPGRRRGGDLGDAAVSVGGDPNFTA